MEWFLKVVKDNYANFNGRARRKEYWMYVLFYCIIAIVASIVDILLAMLIGIPLLSYVVMLALLVPSIAVGVRRMHDVGKSGWFILIPIYNIILFITEGEKGDNQYGPDPKAGE